MAAFSRHPQSVWLRRMLFQVHLWVGIGLGLYIFVVSLSGSLIVFRRELDRTLCPGTLVVTPSGRRFMRCASPPL
ncbi:MAG: PepSY-associated TM helix domain-containing protein [Steroidobacteraceae bacterium]